MLDKINEIVPCVSNFVHAMIYQHHLNEELMWLRVRQEADYQLELLKEVDTPDE